MGTLLCWLLRLLIGSALVASAAGKALDLSGFVEVLDTYRAFPDTTLWPVALSVTGVEFLLGAWVLSGWRLRAGALAATGLNIGYAAWMALSLMRGLSLANCGCFGVFFPRPLTWSSPVEDLIAAGLCYTLSSLAQPENRPDEPAA